ncbi:glycosyltransferase family 2 protein [Candidatus Magnetaquicoccus inordinatus]|uniref:glycosyltransferase family 2 protein n=1 Tax=Candidatus Magnetaquicoccus inordinatus TaxID=2496818 RepID=UPI00102C18A9|nr:glycosyltransferase family 2 protein [Candidatus Magnetaquicoccus inordinatus]
METMPEERRLFSLCIPSYNRGRKALALVERLLPEMEEQWELLLLDNGSHEEQEFYEQIAALAAQAPRLRYVRHVANREFHGNFLACLQLARGDWIMVASDEDWPQVATICKLLPEMQMRSNLGVVRGALPYHTRPEGYYRAGREALTQYGIANTYITGTFYHRQLLEQKGLLQRLQAEIAAHRVYPHLYLELLVGSQCDIWVSQKVVATVGEEQQSGSNAGHSSRYHSVYSLGSRLDLILSLRDGLAEAVHLLGHPFEVNLFCTLYWQLCTEAFRLVSEVNAPVYLDYGLHPGLTRKALLYFCAAAISHYPLLHPYKERILAELARIYGQYCAPPQSEGIGDLQQFTGLLAEMKASAGKSDSFLEAMFRLDTAGNLTAVSQYIQSADFNPLEMVAAVAPLLAHGRDRAAFVLALLLKKRGHRHPSVLLALALGGAVWNHTTIWSEAVSGLPELMAGMMASEQRRFYLRVLVPALSGPLQKAVAVGDLGCVRQLLAVVYAAVPDLRGLFKQDPAVVDLFAAEAQQWCREQAGVVLTVLYRDQAWLPVL